MNIHQKKICRECLVEKDIAEFGNQDITRNGNANLCKPCKSKINRRHYLAKREERLAYQRQHRLDHPEETKQAVREWRKQHPEYDQIKSRDYRKAHREELQLKKKKDYHDNRQAMLEKAAKKRANNREVIRLRTKAYRLKNPEKCKETQRLSRKNHPETKKAARQRRRALKLGAPINDLSLAQWQEILKDFGHRCAYCPATCTACKKKAHRLSQDHVTPYVHNGSHTLWNVVPACREHNSQKHIGPPLVPIQPLLLTLAKANPKKKAS